MCKEEGKAHSCRTRDTKRIADNDVSRGSEDYDGGVAHGSSLVLVQPPTAIMPNGSENSS